MEKKTAINKYDKLMNIKNNKIKSLTKFFIRLNNKSKLTILEVFFIISK